MRIEANTDSRITPNMPLPAHLSVHAPTDRPGYLNLTHRHPSPRPPTQASCLPFLAGEGGEGLGRLGAGSTLVPSLHRLARSFLSGRVSQPSPGSGSPGCSGQTLGGLVSDDAHQQQQQGREGCGRLPTWQTAGRAAGRKLGPFCAHSLGETKPRGLDEQARQLGKGTSCPARALGPHWPQTHWVTLGNLLPFSDPVSFSFSKQTAWSGCFLQLLNLVSNSVQRPHGREMWVHSVASS